MRSAFAFAGSRVPVLQEQAVAEDVGRTTTRTVPEEENPAWEHYHQVTALEIVGDSEVVIDWLNGQSACKDPCYVN